MEYYYSNRIGGINKTNDMKKLIILLIMIALASCSTPKKTLQVKNDRYHNFNGFKMDKAKPMFTGW